MLQPLTKALLISHSSSFISKSYFLRNTPHVNMQLKALLTLFNCFTHQHYLILFFWPQLMFASLNECIIIPPMFLHTILIFTRNVSFNREMSSTLFYL